MGISTGSSNRTKDVLFALEAAGMCQQPLGRLALQKIVYLSDVLSLLWKRIAGPDKFFPWHNGPYDFNVQNTVDALAFRGYVKVQNLHFRTARNAECSYVLSDDGRAVVRTLCSHPVFAADRELYLLIAREVDFRGWEKIRRLVYAEPTYVASSASGHGSKLPTGSGQENLSWQLLKEFKSMFNCKASEDYRRRQLVQMFFSVLDAYNNSTDQALDRAYASS
jgi:hypothetical protein